MNGVPGFVPSRLREAREARGLTAVALAAMVGLTPITLSNYETGKTAPRPETLKRIAETLNFPILHFTRPQIVGRQEAPPIFWRSFNYATKTARTKCAHRLTWLQEIVWYLMEHLELPPIQMPKLQLGDDIVGLAPQDIESAAGEARRFWNLGSGPIDDVVLLMENHGVVVSRFPFDAQALDAFSYSGLGGEPYVILSGDGRSRARTHYSCAHELGHLVLHQSLSERTLKLPERHKAIEDQAFRFSSSFLLPAEAFTAELWAPTIDAFLSLKRRWRVSVGVMIKRCQELELIDEMQARRLWITYSRRGYRKTEPYDDEMGEASPRLLRRSVELLVEEHLRTRDQILVDLSLPQGEIEDLCGLRPGYLSESDRQSVVQQLPRLRQDPPQGRPGGATIVKFDRKGS